MAALCWSRSEEIPHAQGKRNPSKTVGVARGHQRADALKPYSQKTSQSNHTRTTALSNSMKLSHARGATQYQSEWPLSKSLQTVTAVEVVEKENSLILLEEVQIDTTTMDDSVEIP